MGASDDGALLLPPPRLMTQNLLEENPRVPQTPTTPPRLLAAASVFAAFAFPTFSAAPASAQQSGASSLDLTLNTGGRRQHCPDHHNLLAAQTPAPHYVARWQPQCFPDLTRPGLYPAGDARRGSAGARPARCRRS
jgi:hypothetical protein